jgi:hypothetical protein
VQKRAHGLAIAAPDEHVRIGPDAPRRIAVHIVRKRRAFHQEHVQTSRFDGRDEALELETLRHLRAGLTMGACAEAFDERDGELRCDVGRVEPGVQ